MHVSATAASPLPLCGFRGLAAGSPICSQKVGTNNSGNRSCVPSLRRVDLSWIREFHSVGDTIWLQPRKGSRSSWKLNDPKYSQNIFKGSFRVIESSLRCRRIRVKFNTFRAFWFIHSNLFLCQFDTREICKQIIQIIRRKLTQKHYCVILTLINGEYELLAEWSK